MELSNQERVYQDLHERISAGEFSAGEKLPSLRDLSIQYGISVGAVRQGLLKLESEHLVRPQHGRGYYVAREGDEIRVLLVESAIHDHLFSEYVEAFQGIVSGLPTGVLVMESAEPCARKELCRPQELYRKLEMHVDSGVDVCFFDGEKAWGITPKQFQSLGERVKLFYFNTAYPHFLTVGIPGVSIDWYVGGYRALRHLIDIGCRNVICAFTPDTEARQGAMDAVKDSRQQVKLHYFDPRGNLGDTELYPLIQRREIDGLFSNSDALLLGGLSLFASCGYGIHDLAMIGSFDTPWCELSSLTLSSLNVQPQKMVRTVWDMYQGKIPVCQMRMQPELILRDSTLKFRR